MKPASNKAKGLMHFVIAPITVAGARKNTKWSWSLTSSGYNADGVALPDAKKHLTGTRSGVLIREVANNLGSFLAADLEVIAEFHASTGEVDIKHYHLDGSTETLRKTRQGVPAARCEVFPLTKTERVKRREAGKPPKEIGRGPTTGTTRLPSKPPAASSKVPESEAPKRRGRKPKADAKPPEHELLAAFRVVVAEGDSTATRRWVNKLEGSQRRVLGRVLSAKAAPAHLVEAYRTAQATPRTVPPKAEKPPKAKKAPKVPKAEKAKPTTLAPSALSPVVASFAAVVHSGAVADVVSYLRGLDGSARMKLRAQLKIKGTPKDLLAAWDAARPQLDKAEKPAKQKPTTVPPKPVSKPPSAAPRAKKDKVKPESKLTVYAAQYVQEAQNGNGARYLAGLAPVVRGKLRTVIAAEYPSFLKDFDADRSATVRAESVAPVSHREPTPVPRAPSRIPTPVPSVHPASIHPHVSHVSHVPTPIPVPARAPSLAPRPVSVPPVATPRIPTPVPVPAAYAAPPAADDDDDDDDLGSMFAALGGALANAVK